MHHLQARLAEQVREANNRVSAARWKEKIMREESSTLVRALYDVPEAMALLNLSRTQIYELIRSRRLVTVTQGRRRLMPADSISEYVQLLLTEAGGDDGRAA
jgi:excisionase family DNA binding protein